MAVVVGGLLGVGGTIVAVIGTTIRDIAQQRHEKTKRRADKFEELVAAVYDLDHWLADIRRRDAMGIRQRSRNGISLRQGAIDFVCLFPAV